MASIKANKLDGGWATQKIGRIRNWIDAARTECENIIRKSSAARTGNQAKCPRNQANFQNQVRHCHFGASNFGFKSHRFN
jgi:hypothetical protein